MKMGRAETIDELFHKAFRANAYFRPTTIDIRCRSCGTRLKTYYCEDRLYAVKCCFCDTVTLVESRSPDEAAHYVGISHKEVK